MDKLLQKISSFFEWWGKFTKLPRVRYEWPSGRIIVVDWGIIVFVVLIWIAMFVFLPGGLLF
jgi:hypothetical protein